MAQKSYIITGNTYQHRDALRRAGATWDKEAKVWRLTVTTRGFRRTDGAYYQVRDLPGLCVTEDRS